MKPLGVEPEPEDPRDLQGRRMVEIKKQWFSGYWLRVYRHGGGADCFKSATMQAVNKLDEDPLQIGPFSMKTSNQNILRKFKRTINSERRKAAAAKSNGKAAGS